ncbi:MAG: response regulator [Candidatus Aceula lacicola]|nr:response regulator [Candidatus Aceula lacicola]
MSQEKVLIVEDEKELRVLIAQSIEKLDYQVYQAGDGEEALKVAEQVLPDLIITDVVIPKKDGNQLLKDIQKTAFGKNIPFIIMTARAGMRDYFEVLEGVCGFLEKPFKMKELVLMIEEIFTGNSKRGGARFKNKKNIKTKIDKEKIAIKDEAIVKSEILKHEENVSHDDHSLSLGEKKEGVKENKKEECFSEDFFIGKRKILVLENEKNVFQYFKAFFPEDAYAIELVTSSDHIAGRAKEFMPDLIILKHIVGQANSEIVANYLRETFALQWTPIIIYDRIIDRVSGDQSMPAHSKEFSLNSEGKELIKRIKELLGV